MSGEAWINSLATTVATPAKWPGRSAPSSGSVTPVTVTVVAFGVLVYLLWALINPERL